MPWLARPLWLTGWMVQVDTENMPIVVAVKATSTPKEREKMVDILFSRCQAGNVRFLNEAYVLSTQTGNPTSIVVDVGYDLVRVVSPMWPRH